MFKESSAKYYWNNKEKLQLKKFWKNIKVFPKKSKEKRQYDREQYLILQEDEKQNILNIENNITKQE